MVHTSIPSPPISYVSIGPFEIHFYALCILTGIVIAVWISSGRLKRRGVKPGVVLDIALWTVPIGIVGGRLYHVVTHPIDYFHPGANLWNIPAVWEGGLAIFGAILFGSIGAYIGCRRAGIRFLTFADALVPGLLLAQAFGRLGNYFNQELFGAPTTLPWGLQIKSSAALFPPGLPAGTLFQPLFLYEMIWNTLGALLLIFVLEKRFGMRWGRALGFYLIWYGVGRAYLESIRIDPTEFHFLGLKINEEIALGAAIGGIMLIIVQSLRHRGSEPVLTGPKGFAPGTTGSVDAADGEVSTAHGPLTSVATSDTQDGP
ncbi:MAG: prolipoprotein diacylglyceryl transferase [Lacisediminihabitans sp.]